MTTDTPLPALSVSVKRVASPRQMKASAPFSAGRVLAAESLIDQFALPASETGRVMLSEMPLSFALRPVAWIWAAPSGVRVSASWAPPG